MNQRTFFGEFDRQRIAVPAARKTDPETSHEAARRVVRSGQSKRDREAILAVIRTHGPLTAGEIAAQLGSEWTNVRVSRRTVELENADLITRSRIRICSVKGTAMVTWVAVEKAK